MYPLLALYSDWAIFVLRVAVGLVMVAHGLPKLKDPKGTGNWLSSVGFKPGTFWAVILVIAEFFGGLALILGLFTQIAAALLAIEFLVIVIWRLKQNQKLVGGYELDLVLFAAALALLTLGSGAFSLERYLFGGY